MFVILLLTYILSVLSELEDLISSTIRDNKLIAVYSGIESFNTNIRAYELKEGPVADIFNSRKTFNFGRTEENFALKFLDIPGSLQEVPPFMNWVGYLNLSDMSLQNSTGFIEFPTHESFPVRGYTTNTITNELGSALYITGGELYSKKDDSISVSNSFYKYNFTTKNWTDMTYSADGKLKPLTEHKSVVIDNRYLIILGGRRPINYHLKYSIYDFVSSKFEYSSLYNLTIFDTFTNTWENVNANADIFDASIATLKFVKFLATVQKGKVIIYGSFADTNQSIYSYPTRQLGIFDLKSKNWTWNPILNEDGTNYKGGRDERGIQVLNDQLIICTDVNEGESYIPIMVYDMPNKRLKSTLRLSDKSDNADIDTEKSQSQNQSKTLPIYAIVLISISCTVLLAAFIYLLYRKIKNKQKSKNGNTKYSGPIREVWANPDGDNMNNIITFD
ncbi:hypothetical protein CONCODRAFT_1916 [Conidiobolus coronatus NRRL 28638]|uniref:Galactose oxidase n=1 Tax=Conidiobolus coronatus (strain ATCC 28846 / CBS 209.66 / NRRL 28638) TaxID=796925 RepID=A0A137PIT9_CONC2|nr:hypothetical protein CONCODRAFT_1916 [Conidiobolus coronatus NRRL 28638]|eukprot:KXN74851.1 hypothetical protein CONCODRAFT_1916 [Conidiobolus coronatus NRRL 28638]